jgi:hypothetical protein
MVADVVGSLKKPCKAGRPDLPSGQMEESLSAKKSKLILGVQGLSIKPLSDPILERINPNVFMFESSLSSL